MLDTNYISPSLSYEANDTTPPRVVSAVRREPQPGCLRIPSGLLELAPGCRRSNCGHTRALMLTAAHKHAHAPPRHSRATRAGICAWDTHSPGKCGLVNRFPPVDDVILQKCQASAPTQRPADRKISVSCGQNLCVSNLVVTRRFFLLFSQHDTPSSFGFDWHILSIGM